MAFTVDLVAARKTTWQANERPLAHAPLAPPNGALPLRSAGGGGSASAAASCSPNAAAHSPRPQGKVDSRRLSVSRIRSFGGHAVRPGWRSQAASMPPVTQQPDLRLSHAAYDLPPKLVSNLSSLGINLIYPWQAACLQDAPVLAGAKNFVYTASTGAGKSLVADVLMLKRVLDGGKKAILVLPYVALVQEKTKWLRSAVDGLDKHVELAVPGAFAHHRDDRNVRVVPFHGGGRHRATLDDADIAVCTIEKANALVNSALEEGGLEELGIVVLDELHMIDDLHRGYLLELLASKILSLEQGIQLVGMSATLSNVEDLAKWLGARWYESDYKPVPVAEYLVHENRIYPLAAVLDANKNGIPRKNARALRAIEPSKEPELSRMKHNAVISLAMETYSAGYGVLVFCSSRAGCQHTAGLIAKATPLPSELDPEVLRQRMAVLYTLRSFMDLDLDPILEQIIPRGVGFHHAGLTTEERETIAEAFDQGILKALVATSSLAAGINLPARRVFLQEARQGRDFVAPSMLRQMRGRAGRKGKDEVGESFVCCTDEDVDEVEQLLEDELPPITSCLVPGKRGLEKALLEVIAIRLANHEDGIQDYVRNTLTYCLTEKAALDGMVQDGIDQLLRQQLVEEVEGQYTATALGKATVAAGLTPEDGVFVHNEIQQALQHFVLDCDLHAIYMFTPINMTVEINWNCFLREIGGLSEAELRVMQFCRVDPRKIKSMANASSALPERTPEDVLAARIYRRFYVALQLRALCDETPVQTVASRFDVSRGSVQSLSANCQAFAAGIISFCQRLGWGMLAAVLEHMQDRLRAGARADLLDLARIPFVKSRTARTLWDNGYRSLRSVSEAEASTLAQVLLLAQPRKRKSAEEEEGYLRKVRARAEIVIAQAGRLWEKDQMVVDMGAEL